MFVIIHQDIIKLYKIKYIIQVKLKYKSFISFEECLLK